MNAEVLITAVMLHHARTQRDPIIVTVHLDILAMDLTVPVRFFLIFFFYLFIKPNNSNRHRRML